jgi:hypothetical protein
MPNETLLTPRQWLTTNTISVHQAIDLLTKKLKATDCYQQRAEQCEDSAPKEVPQHNMRKEIEHASIILKWIRRNIADAYKELKENHFQPDILNGHEVEATS